MELQIDYESDELSEEDVIFSITLVDLPRFNFHVFNKVDGDEGWHAWKNAVRGHLFHHEYMHPPGHPSAPACVPADEDELVDYSGVYAQVLNLGE